MKQIFHDRPIQTIVFLCFFIASIALLIFRPTHKTAVVQIGEKKVYVQIAKTLAQQRRGLGGREDLGEFGGMIFPIIPERRQGMVMRDMKFPIDIIWVLDGYIVDIAPNVSVSTTTAEGDLITYFPRKEANAVIEVPAGFVDVYGIEIGDRVSVLDE
jgi:uncharacterized membrane protein (UPF0127 family)